MRDGAYEVVLPLPERVEPVRNIRSTLLHSSYASIRDAGYDKQYRAALPQQYHAAIFETVAGMWIPIEIAVAHWDACATLGLSHDRQITLGRDAGKKIEGTILGTAVRMAREAGVTPWTVMPHFNRFWRRAFDGGAMYVERRGPKEALMEVHRAAQADCVYWRAALAGLGMGVIELFSHKAYISEMTKQRRVPGFAAFRVQWV